MNSPAINPDYLLKLRLVVARYGEMDVARLWNTKGQLGRLGATALRRGFPRTHLFAQARSVFAVAAHRCAEVFDPPGAVTLWRLPMAVEQEFKAAWEGWLENASEWATFFKSIESLPQADLAASLRELGLVSEADLTAYAQLRTYAQGRTVQLPNTFSATPSDIALLALGFARSKTGSLAVPYALYDGV